jgi:hypothetical protein
MVDQSEKPSICFGKAKQKKPKQDKRTERGRTELFSNDSNKMHALKIQMALEHPGIWTPSEDSNTVQVKGTSMGCVQYPRARAPRTVRSKRKPSQRNNGDIADEMGGENQH